MHVAKRKGLEADIAAAFVELRLQGEGVDAELNENLWLPDENDLHVLSGAIASKATILLTENLRDFPRAALEPFGIIARTPDALYFELLEQNDEILAGYSASVLKRAKLYKTAKHIKA